MAIDQGLDQQTNVGGCCSSWSTCPIGSIGCELS
jgi:hypothetical protein